MTKILSVIIPTYNRAAYIEEAISSVLSQELPKDYKIEVIVIDDGSTDETEKIIKHFGKKIIYKKIKHSGKPAVARNVGLKLAKGEFIAFQDSDDVWPEKKLKIQLPYFDDKNVVMTFGQAEIINSAGKNLGKKVIDELSMPDVTTYEALLKTNLVSTLTVMLRREVLDKAGYFNEADKFRGIEDYELWLRIAAAYPGGLRYIDQTLAKYRTHNNNISNVSQVESLLKIREVLYEQQQLRLSDFQLEQVEEALVRTEENISRQLNLENGQPQISVVMSVFNGGKFLRPAIDGILSQTFTDFEFIIINDGSKDNSRQLIESYTDPRIRLINQSNRGLVYSLNKGVKIARGRFIARQDADDISLPSRLEKELQLITTSERLGLVGSFFTYISEAESEPSTTITSTTKDLDLKRSLLIVNPFAHGSTLTRREAIIEAGGYRDNYGPTEDYDLWRRMMNNWEFAVVPESLYWYRINPNSISHQKQEIQHKFAAQIASEIWRDNFCYKGYRTIVSGGKIYKQSSGIFSHHIYNQYVNEKAAANESK